MLSFKIFKDKTAKYKQSKAKIEKWFYTSKVRLNVERISSGQMEIK